IASRRHAEQVDERNAAPHSGSKSYIVPMLWIRAAIPVAQKAVGAELVIIGASLSLNDRLGHDTERHLWENRGLEDALRSQQRHPLALELKSLGQDSER